VQDIWSSQVSFIYIAHLQNNQKADQSAVQIRQKKEEVKTDKCKYIITKQDKKSKK